VSLPASDIRNDRVGGEEWTHQREDDIVCFPVRGGSDHRSVSLPGRLDIFSPAGNLCNKQIKRLLHHPLFSNPHEYE
jgi:hypothetical protein